MRLGQKIFKKIALYTAIFTAGAWFHYHTQVIEDVGYDQSLVEVAIEQQDSDLMGALIGMDTASLDARQPLHMPVGVPPLPTEKPLEEQI